MAAIEISSMRPELAKVLANVNEAAFVSGVTRHAVNQAIDRGEIRTRGKESATRIKTEAPARKVGIPELIYLTVQSFLSPHARKVIYKKLARLEVNLEAKSLTIELDGGIRLDITASVAGIRARLDELARISSMVEENPEIRGGEPVFRGTRIPVQMIASFVQEGVPAAELLEDYPALTAESLEIATRYVELYPRRGRPRHAPWRAAEPTHVINPQTPSGGRMDGVRDSVSDR
jgi:uncharacterized protein (DUF433 family)